MFLFYLIMFSELDIFFSEMIQHSPYLMEIGRDILDFSYTLSIYIIFFIINNQILTNLLQYIKQNFHY